jgi:phage shock protein A
MGVLSRILRLCKADLHGVMDQIEDRELLLKQYLREMEAALTASRNRLARLKTRKTRTERELAVCREQLTAMQADISLAVAKAKEDIARMLIRKKFPLSRQAVELEARRRQLQAEIETGEATLARQTAAQAKIQQQVAAEADTRGAISGYAAEKAALRAAEPSKEEIELELLQYQEALQAGRPS